MPTPRTGAARCPRCHGSLEEAELVEVAAPFSGPVAILGPGAGFFPSVWLDVIGMARGVHGPPGGVVTFSLDQLGGTTPLQSSVPMPPGYGPEAHVGSDFLVSGPVGQASTLLRLWRPVTGFGTTFGHVRSVMGISGPTVAWISADGCDASNLERPMHLTDVGTGADHVVTPPLRHYGFLLGGAVGPGGSRIAAFVAGGNSQHPSADLAVVDTGDANSTLVPGSEVEVGEPLGYASWTPDAAYVLFCGVKGTLRAWSPDGGPVLDTRQPASYRVLAY